MRLWSIHFDLSRKYTFSKMYPGDFGQKIRLKKLRILGIGPGPAILTGCYKTNYIILAYVLAKHIKISMPGFENFQGG